MQNTLENNSQFCTMDSLSNDEKSKSVCTVECDVDLSTNSDSLYNDEKLKSVGTVECGVDLSTNSDSKSVVTDSDSKLAYHRWFSCGGGGGVFGLRREKKKVKIEREYPPPIPGLAKTENVPSSQMPWVMKRYHTSDGRLIIKEEKVKRFEYFETHRTDGRLMLNLVPLNDDVCDSDDDDDEVDGGDVIETDGCDQGKDDRTAAPEENESALVNGGGSPVIGGGGSGGVKCSSLCTFGVAAPAIRPVHT